MDDLYEVMKETLPEIAEAFIADYKDVVLMPRVVGLAGQQVLICDRCQSYVSRGGADLHRLWHRNISASIWMLQGWSLAHMKEHDEFPRLEPTGTRTPHPASCGGCRGKGCPEYRLVLR